MGPMVYICLISALIAVPISGHQIKKETQAKIRFMTEQWRVYRNLTCSDDIMSTDKLEAIDECYRKSIFSSNTIDDSYDVCRQQVFDRRRSRDEIRRLLCHNRELRAWYNKCLSMQTRQKVGEIQVAYHSIDDFLDRVWPLYLERKICLEEALGIRVEQSSNHVDNHKDNKEQFRK
ncbi:hypothetical protein HDE_01952 [Halotydeus destructor]|nr:hypothetical protein HDE_01952 [Halotydeus destructor]